MKGTQQIFTRNLKILLARNELTRKDLSLALKIPYSTVEGWYKGKTYPRASALDKLADFFEVDVSMFLCDPDNTIEQSNKSHDKNAPDFDKLNRENRKKVIEYIQFLRLKELNNENK